MIKRLYQSLITRLIFYFLMVGILVAVLFAINIAHGIKVHFKQEVLDHKVEGKPLPPNRMCIFCLRNETLKHYLESCAGQRVYDRNSAIQIHRNSVEEYHPHFMVTGDSEMRKGLIDPIVTQTLSSTHFQYVEENGRKFYRQLIPRPTPEQLKHFLLS